MTWAFPCDFRLSLTILPLNLMQLADRLLPIFLHKRLGAFIFCQTTGISYTLSGEDAGRSADPIHDASLHGVQKVCCQISAAPMLSLAQLTFDTNLNGTPHWRD